MMRRFCSEIIICFSIAVSTHPSATFKQINGMNLGAGFSPKFGSKQLGIKQGAR